jgi:hypothetical protein
MNTKQQQRMERYEAKVAAETAELIEAGLSPEVAAEKARKFVTRPGAGVEGTVGFAAKGTVIYVAFDLSEAVGTLTPSGKNTVIGRTTGGMLPVVVDGKTIMLGGKVVQFTGGLYVDEQGTGKVEPAKSSAVVPAVHARTKGGKGKGTQAASTPALTPSQTSQPASQAAPEGVPAPTAAPAPSAPPSGA